MLVLVRRSGQTLIIADNIRVSVVSVGRGRVQLGIEAPRDVRIHRPDHPELFMNKPSDRPRNCGNG
ncbi:MAG: carbon storage regulator [Planctomyces sp.]|nr:carbon storage regulator [Planctomyces sp.]